MILGKFARSGIESLIGSDVAAGVQAALLHYARRLRSDLRPVKFPRFCRGLQQETVEMVFDIPLDPYVQQSLELEVQRQGASLEELASHAVLVYLADLDRAIGMDARPAPATGIARTAKKETLRRSW